MADKLSYEQFKEWILENYKSMLPADMQSYVAEIQKHEKLTETYEGMGFVPNPKPSRCISAQLNLNKLYKDYCNSSLEIDKIVGPAIFNVIEVQSKAPVSINQLDEQIFNYDFMKTKLCMRVVNYERHQEMVDNSPHKIINDLAVVYYCIINKDNNGISSTRVTEDLMERWGINLDELQADAELYHSVNMEPVFISMREMLSKQMGMPDCMLPTAPIEEPYVLTTKDGVFGASEIACPDVLKNVGNYIGDFTIIPSSVHELLIIPDSLGMPSDYLLDTLGNVNDTNVPSEDVLSYNTYHYDSIENELTMISRDSIDHDTDDIEF